MASYFPFYLPNEEIYLGTVYKWRHLQGGEGGFAKRWPKVTLGEGVFLKNDLTSYVQKMNELLT